MPSFRGYPINNYETSKINFDSNRSRQSSQVILPKFFVAGQYVFTIFTAEAV